MAHSQTFQLHRHVDVQQQAQQQRRMPATCCMTPFTQRAPARRAAAALRLAQRQQQARRTQQVVCAAAATSVEKLVVQPITVIEGHVKLPGSKSLSNRILLLAALAEGTTVVENILVGGAAWARALRAGTAHALRKLLGGG